MITLTDLIAGMAPDGDSWTIEAPTDWMQGRTLYGGLTGALSVAAAQRAVPGLPPLRSAQFTFVGPAAGLLRFRPELVRQGRSATIVTVDARTEEGLAGRATLIFGAARESEVVHDRTAMPAVPPPDDCPSFIHPDPTKRPAFHHHIDMRLAAGSRPFTGGGTPEFAIWGRLLDADGVDPAVALVALGDCTPPAAFFVFPKPAPISSMNWTIDFGHMPASADGWHLLTSTSEQAADGYSLQPMQMWNADGRRVAGGRQVVAIFA